MNILKFFKIKLSSGEKILDSLTSYNERLEYAKKQLYKKKSLLEKHATSIHTNVQVIEDKINTATDNANEALAHAEQFLKNGDELQAKLQFKQYETAKRARELYVNALEKAKIAKEKVDEAVSNYDIAIGDVLAKIAELTTMMEVNAVTEFTADDGIPTEISEFLTKIESDIKHETFEQKSRAEVAALTKVSTVKLDNTRINTDAEFEKFKERVLHN